MMRINKTSRLLFSLAIGLVALFGVGRSAHAATMQASPSSGSYQIGDTLRIAVTVSSPVQSINAASGTLAFPSDKLQFLSASKDGSIMTIWAQDPSYSEYAGAGSVSFEGVVPNPGFTGSNGKIITVAFRVKAVGTATLSFAQASVLANDGMGTNVLTSYMPATFTLGASVLPLSTPAPVPEAPIGNVPKIASSTHPDQTKWYSNSNPRFSWKLPADVTGVSVLLDKTKSTHPDMVSIGAVLTYEAANLSDGVWYLHVRFKDSDGWGATAHFKLQIDTVKPESFAIQQVPNTDPKDPTSRFRFIAFDKTSDVKSYDVQIDNAYFVPWTDDGSHTYVTEALGPGSHTMSVKAYDSAGNFATGWITFSVYGINPPIMTEYPRYLGTGSYLLLKGTTYPNVEVDIYVHKAKDGDLLTSQPLVFERQADQAESIHKVIADSRGSFTFVSDDKLQSGTYEVWAKAVNELGASSAPTPTLIIPVSRGAFAKVGIFVINIFTVLFIILGLLIVLAFLLIHGHYKVRHLRERLIGKYFGDDRDSRAGLACLDKGVQKEIISIQQKIMEKEKISAEEKAFLVRIKKVLGAIEDTVDKDVDGLKNL